MFTLHIEHTVADYDQWKQMFDSDPLDRKGSGVRRYRVMRPVADPTSVMVDLEFESREAAESLGKALDDLWQGPAAAMTINPRRRISETVDAGEL